MKVEDIKKQLDKFEIPYTADDLKDDLQKKLDDELARRAAGNDDDGPATPDDDDALLQPAEEQLSDAERRERLAAAEARQAKAQKAKEAADAELAAAGGEVAKYLAQGSHVSLAEANKGFHAKIRRESAIARQTANLMARFNQEAEKLLQTDEAE
jgi:hypothetical protein